MVAIVRIDHGAVQRLLTRVSSECAHRAANVTQRRVRSNIVASGRVRTGKMLNSIKVEPVKIAASSTYQVVSHLDYTIYQEQGIGPVHARPGGVLRFQPKGSGVFIFRPRTRGFAGAHFFRDAERQIRLTDFL